MTTELIPIYILIFAFGIVIGSFLNVCIYRIPQHETVVTERSHCMRCGYQLAWYDMVPVFSWLFLQPAGEGVWGRGTKQPPFL